MIFSTDNRRLRLFQEAGKEIPYKKVDWNDLSKSQKRHHRTNTDGESIIEVKSDKGG